MSSASSASAIGQMTDLRQQFEACSASAKKLMESLSEDQLKERPKSREWSIAECIAHLTLTNELYFPILDVALQTAPSGGGPYKMDWRGRLLKWVLEPPYRFRAKTLTALEPALETVGKVLPDFLASQQQLVERIQEWDGRAQDQVLITSPFTKRLRYNIYSLFNVIAAHQRHHLWQAQRVKDQIKGN